MAESFYSCQANIAARNGKKLKRCFKKPVRPERTPLAIIWEHSATRKVDRKEPSNTTKRRAKWVTKVDAPRKQDCHDER